MGEKATGKLFELKGKAIAIVDWANVFGWFGRLHWKVDPKRLFRYLKTYSEIKDTRFYFGVEKGNQKSEAFQVKVREIGYTLVSKEVKWVPVSLDKSHFKAFLGKLIEIADGLESSNTKVSRALRKLPRIPIYRRKCDFDCEIAIDAMKNLNRYDGYIIFSGDGDYAVLVNELIKAKKQVIVVFAPGCKGKEYEDFKKGLFLCSVERVKEFVKE